MVPNCCYPDEYGKFFRPQEARRTAKRLRRRGLRGSERALADAVAARGIEGACILEVGGGVGGLHTTLLGEGAARAVNVELSPSWEGAANALLRDLDLLDRVDRRLGDFVDDAADLPDADVVVLHRVLCCYPDWPALTDAAGAKARRVAAFTVPVDNAVSRAVVRFVNAFLRWRGSEFRAFVHPITAIVDRFREAGFERVHDHTGLVWRTIVVERPG